MTALRARIARRLIVVALPLLGAALAALLVVHPRPAQAAAKVVGSGTAGSCNETTLRQALAGGGDITFNCSAAPSPIVVASELIITATTTIDGDNGGSAITISGGGATRIFRVGSAASLEIYDLTIRDGDLSLGRGAGILNEGYLFVTNSRLISNTTTDAWEGGAIASFGPVVVLNNTELSNNRAGDGGGLYLYGAAYIADSRIHHNTARRGGGIFSGPGYVLSILDSQIDHNQTVYYAGAGEGAGISSRGDLTVTQTLIHDNETQSSLNGSRGGGLYHEGGRLVLNDVAFDRNRANEGGGIFLHSGNGDFTHLSFVQNRAQLGGGGGLSTAGDVTLSGAVFDRNVAFTDGGGVSNAGTLTLVDATLTANRSSSFGGGVGNVGTLTLLTATVSSNSTGDAGDGYGGGIGNYGNLEAHNVVVAGNLAQYDGGGLYNSGSLWLTDASVLDNISTGGDEVGSTPFGGGGLFNTGYAVLENTLLAGNRTLDVDGGGIYNHGGLVVLVDSTLASNAAADDGGGLVNNRGTLSAVNVTFSQNTAGGWGGAILSDHGATGLSFATITGNSAAAGGGLYNLTIYSTATLHVEATLLTGNSPGLNCDQFTGSVNLQSGGYNLSDDGSFDPVTGGCPAFGSTDLIHPSPVLGPLIYGNGPTPIHPLLPGSPAIDAIPIDSPGGEECGTDLENDQRGIARPTDGDINGTARCDIGAVEYVPGERPIHLWLPLARR